MKFILFSKWDPCCNSPDAKAAVHESSSWRACWAKSVVGGEECEVGGGTMSIGV